MQIKFGGCMEILTGQNLADKVRNLCNNVKRRLWIASPYIGSWSAIRRILGRKWIDSDSVDVRLIVDLSDSKALNLNTIKCFRDRSQVKYINALHAKIYIIDNQAIITSANLTGTAFSRRYEIGVLVDKRTIGVLEKLYDIWWKEIATNMPNNLIRKIDITRRKSYDDEYKWQGLPLLWRLGADPGDPYAEVRTHFYDYQAFLHSYEDFSFIYKAIQRVWRNAPLYFETDSFLNYLFHEHSKIPSKKYEKAKPRQLNEKLCRLEIRRYAKQFKTWIAKGGDSRWRERSSRLIRQRLSKINISKIKRSDVSDIVDQLPSLNSVHIARSKFLNPENNSIQAIRSAWNILLHGDGPVQTRMSQCDSLYSFSRSSICELLGFYYPSQYPIRNKNSNAGLRFFGYDVAAY